MPDELDAIRARRAAVPRPPWRWSGYKHGQVELTTAHSGRMRLISTSTPQPCELWWEIGEHDEMCATCRTWYELREAVEHPDDCTNRRPRHSGKTRYDSTCVDRFDADLAGAACHACARHINAREEWDDERSPRCEKPENLHTVWIGDPTHGFVEPINKYATLERTYRDDILPVVEHPTAEFIRRAPEDIDALLAEIDRLRGALVAIVGDEVEWDVRIHRSAKARTTLRALLGEVRSDD